MSLKSLLVTCLFGPLLAGTSAQAETDYVILKNPKFTDVLRIGYDLEKETVSLERCFLLSVSESRCQMIGQELPIAEISQIRKERNTQDHWTAGGAFLGFATFFGVTTYCIQRGRCAGLMKKLFPDYPKDSFDWGLYGMLGITAAGGALGYTLGSPEESVPSSVLQIEDAIEEALARDDREAGDLIIESSVSLSQIAESFSMLQLLVQKRQAE